MNTEKSLLEQTIEDRSPTTGNIKTAIKKRKVVVQFLLQRMEKSINDNKAKEGVPEGSVNMFVDLVCADKHDSEGHFKKHLPIFSHEQQIYIAKKLIARDVECFIKKHLAYFPKLSEEIGRILIKKLTEYDYLKECLYILLKNFKKFEPYRLKQSDAINLIKEKQGQLVISNIHCFDGIIFDENIALLLIANDQYGLFFKNIHFFKGVKLDSKFAKKICKDIKQTYWSFGSHRIREIFSDHIHLFEDDSLGKTILAQVVSSFNWHEKAISFRKKFKVTEDDFVTSFLLEDPKKALSYMQATNYVITEKLIINVIKKARINTIKNLLIILPQFGLSSHKGIIFAIVKQYEREGIGAIEECYRNGIKYVGLDKETFLFLRQNNCTLSLEFFSGLDNEIAEHLMKANSEYTIAYGMRAFPDASLSAKVAYGLCRKGYFGNVIHFKYKFHKLSDVLLIRESLKNLTETRLEEIVQYNQKNNFPDKCLKISYEIFGHQLTLETYNIIDSILKGTLDPEIKKQLKIRGNGEAGVSQLKDSIRTFRKNITQPNFDPTILLSNKILRSVFQEYIRFESSEWGSHSQSDFNGKIQTFIEYKKHGEIASLPEYFTPSGNIGIDRTNKEAIKQVTYSEQFLNRFGVLSNSLQEAQRHSNSPQNHIQTLIKGILATREKIVNQLKIQLSEKTHEKAREGIQEKISSLETVSIQNFEDVLKCFSTLCEYRELHESLRQIVFAYMFSNHAQQAKRMENIDINNLVIDDITGVINIVGHITLQETLFKLPELDTANKKSLLGLLNIRALEEELVRIQGNATKGVTQMKFVPTRNILLEFSGHIADACWASRYDISRYPNVTALVMVQHPETMYERMAGACLLIETRAKNGDQLLVIRGLNPIENFINDVSVPDFFIKMIDYLRQQAKSGGRKLAIVIDNHAGGSGTNRPTLFQYLSSIKSELKPAQIMKSEETNFNEYDITPHTYLL